MRLFRLTVISAIFVLSSVLIHGQAAPDPSPQSASAASKKIIEYSLPPDKLEKSHALYLQSVRFDIIDTIYGFVVLLALLYFGVAARFRNLAERRSQNKWLQGLIIFPLFILTITILSIPSDVYHHHVSLSYGLSVQGWGSWWVDWGKTLLLSLFLETFLLLLVYAMIRRSAKRWWFYSWLCGIPIIVFIMFIAPIVIEPLYFTYSPLDQTNPELVTQIERVVKRGGLDIPRSRMYSMNASAKFTGDNAYVSGFGASKRVVVWDTTQKHMTPEEIMFVFGT